jgi:chemotaxis protein histidine kinase CheA
MKRFRLSTLMLLVVIVAMGTALVMQSRRATNLESDLVVQSRRAADLEAELEVQSRRAANLEAEMKERMIKWEKLKANYTNLIRELRGKLDKQARLPIGTDGAASDGK